MLWNYAVKAPRSLSVPHICPLCFSAEEDLQHVFFTCSYANNCWQRLFAHFKLNWVIDNSFCDNVLQILISPKLKPTPKLLGINVVKSLLAELWFERNQRVLHDKTTPWLDRFETAQLNTSLWCSRSNTFANFTIQDISLNWSAFIFPPFWFQHVSVFLLFSHCIS